MKRGGGPPLKSLCLVISLSSAVIVFLLTPFLRHNNWQLQLTVATISGNVCDSIFFKSECCDLVLVVLVVCSSGSSANDATLPAPVALPARPVTVWCSLTLLFHPCLPHSLVICCSGMHSLVIIVGNNVHAPLDLVLCGEGDITGALLWIVC